MKLAFYIYLARTRFVLAAVMLLKATAICAQIPLNEQTLETLRSKPGVEVEQFADDWIKTAVDRRDAAQSLAGILADEPSLVEHAALIRAIGQRIEPEFTKSVLAEIEATADPLARGGLLQLLRGPSPDIAASIQKWLSDKRPGEDLVEQSKRAPKLRQAIANGAVALRVCDIAFNVMQETGVANKANALRLTRFQSMESRDKHSDDTPHHWRNWFLS